MAITGNPVIDLALPHPREAPLQTIATLGPAGTSSEVAANALGHYLASGWSDCRSAFDVTLHGGYELAAASLHDGAATMLVVANAYHGASTFYMDPRLTLGGAFCMDTPHYGVATTTGHLPAGAMRISSHPAPIPIIDQLLPDADRAREVIRYHSTSAAAGAAADGEVDAALTTAPAAERYGLTFATPTRTIRMLWSVFVPRAATWAPGVGVTA